MGKPSERTIKREIKRLREYIDDNPGDQVGMRIAYEVETALRWATESTTGWDKPLESCLDAANILRRELRAARSIG
jgi:hypothetical protein